MTILRHVRPAFAALARELLAVLTARPVSDLVLPPYPLRCQHCEEPIQLAATGPSTTVVGHDGALFRDPSGAIVCDDMHRILHRPMPSVLG